MTTEERLSRIEHVTAGIDEERRKDREENRQIWRDTQRQIAETQRQIGETQRNLGELSIRVMQMGEELRDADVRLGNRVEALVTAIGQLTARMGIPPQPPA
ncbi:MAG TPA: hypothetical protein VN829_22825 [Dongiaceae bacterium]|nr:hypothetical protein [Dongiaceae bacterium]